MRYHVGIGKRGKKADIFAFFFSQNEFFSKNSKQKSHQKGGEPVSFEAIASITQAEADAKASVAQADAKARQMRIDAENAGKAAIDAAAADNELAELRRQADEKAMDAAGGLSKELESTKAELRAKAETKLAQAATLVVERIVNS